YIYNAACTCFILVCIFHEDCWCYQPHNTCNDTCLGPEVWGEVYQQCNNRSQSPINIVTRRVLPDERLTPFQFIGYKDMFHGQLINNGHTVELNLPSSIKIKGGNLEVPYKAVQLHMHWGKEGGLGSEHTIDGEQFPMEMHIVHIKEEYTSLSQAKKDPIGLAVLGFFIEVILFKYLKKNHVSLDMFIPPQENLTKYFRYNGSLTTPNCSEAVVWTLFENTIFLSRKQLASFSQLRYSNGGEMTKTFRPVQPLNGRRVYHSRGHVDLVSPGLLILAGLVSSALFSHTTG
uniref:Carbonic anhydrase n=1 Tax=Mastacembelus armatus TaxID=205130 RepID=A0A7N9AWY3_9TELE